MKVLIFGASSAKSIGFQVGENLKKLNIKIIYASRSGRMGVKCDINKPLEVNSIIKKEKPDIVINCAGVFHETKSLGEIDSWNGVKENILVKSVGNLVLVNEIIKLKMVDKLIIVGGRDPSSHPGFVGFTVGNGAVWSLVKFAHKHTKIKVFYLDLPLVYDSAMVYELLGSKNLKSKGVDILSVTKYIEKIINNKYKSGARVVVKERVGGKTSI